MTEVPVLPALRIESAVDVYSYTPRSIKIEIINETDTDYYTSSEYTFEYLSDGKWKNYSNKKVFWDMVAYGIKANGMTDLTCNLDNYPGKELIEGSYRIGKTLTNDDNNDVKIYYYFEIR